MSRLCGRAREELQRIMFEPEGNAIRWGEVAYTGRSSRQEPRVTLHLTPVSVAEVLQEALWNRTRSGGVIMMSATLANSDGFSYQRARLGVPESAMECLVGSPF